MNYSTLTHSEFVTYYDAAVERFLAHGLPVPDGLMVEAVNRLVVLGSQVQRCRDILCCDVEVN